MLSDFSRKRLIEIRHNIALAYAWTGTLTLEEFSDDTMRLYAVVRALEIISEASRGLPEDLRARHPEIPWRAVAGAGNVYRHDYDGVQERYILRTVREALPPLLAAVESELNL
ncbi:MAG: HepT-like ribonuclease domain-containing protein [Devosia sp.]